MEPDAGYDFAAEQGKECEINFRFIVKNATNVIGEPERQVFLVSDMTGEEGPHYYQAAILPDTGGLTACQFVAERLRKPGGEPGLSVDELDVALEFLEKGNPPPLVAFVKAYVDQALKKAMSGSLVSNRKEP